MPLIDFGVSFGQPTKELGDAHRKDQLASLPLSIGLSKNDVSYGAASTGGGVHVVFTPDGRRKHKVPVKTSSGFWYQ